MFFFLYYSIFGFPKKEIKQKGCRWIKEKGKKGRKVYVKEGDQEKMTTDPIRWQNRDCSQKELIHVPEPATEWCPDILFTYIWWHQPHRRCYIDANKA